jgi:hypothetical protein
MPLKCGYEASITQHTENEEEARASQRERKRESPQGGRMDLCGQKTPTENLKVKQHSTAVTQSFFAAHHNGSDIEKVAVTKDFNLQ